MQYLKPWWVIVICTALCSMAFPARSEEQISTLRSEARQVVEKHWDASARQEQAYAHDAQIQASLKEMLMHNKDVSDDRAMLQLIQDEIEEIQKCEVMLKALLTRITVDRLSDADHKAVFLALEGGTDPVARTAVACLTRAEDPNWNEMCLDEAWCKTMSRLLRLEGSAGDVLAWQLVERAKCDSWGGMPDIVPDYHEGEKAMLADAITRTQMRIIALRYLQDISASLPAEVTPPQSTE